MFLLPKDFLLVLICDKFQEIIIPETRNGTSDDKLKRHSYPSNHLKLTLASTIHYPFYW